MYICHGGLLYLNIISRMVNWILLLGSIYVASILCYDIYKDYKKEHQISPLRVIGVGVCLFYVVRSMHEVLLNQ